MKAQSALKIDSDHPDTPADKRIAVIGGGLAGLAAALRLSQNGIVVDLFESKRRLGGRAGSFQDLESNQAIDHCQHVAMDCCTNYRDFCRQLDCEHFFDRVDSIPFYASDGRRFDLTAAKLPAPLHLAPFLLRLGFLTLGERLRIAKAMLSLARTGPSVESMSIGDWLRGQGQSASSMARFWSVVLVSALGEDLARASVAAAKKVFVDGFMATRSGYQLLIPNAPLCRLYDRMAQSLRQLGVGLHLGAPIRRVVVEPQQRRRLGVVLGDGQLSEYDGVVVAVDWRALPRLFPDASRDAIPAIEWCEQLKAAPITSVHLWFDRPITDAPPQAVLIDRLAQWIFHRPGGNPTASAADGEFYYQVVISASRELSGRSQDEVVEHVRSELASVWSNVNQARLLRSQLVTQRDAVFSYRPGLDDRRPLQKTQIEGLALAGDWTATNWPATMEGAVRSGFLAADELLDQFGRAKLGLAPEPKRSFLTRCLIGKAATGR